MTDGQSYKKGVLVAIIVDKVQKKKDIALACKKLIIQKSIKDITIAEAAKTAGVGKGTIYEYFSNKDEIVFEIVNILMYEYNLLKEKRLEEASTAKEKIKIFFYIFYTKEDEDLRSIYKEFVSISLMKPDEKMMEFQTACTDRHFAWFEAIIQEGIDNNEFVPEAKKLARGLFSIGEGLFVSSEVTHSIKDVKVELNNFFDTLFNLIGVKK